MSRKLVIFDLDGTILDTIGDLAAAVNFALKKNLFPARSVEEVTRFVGNGMRNLILRALPEKVSEEVFAAVFADFKDYYRDHCADSTRPYPGIADLLSRLRKEGFLLAVLSNKSDGSVKVLCEKFYPNAFDAVAGEKEGIARKPSPEGIEAILSSLSVEKTDTVYVGDSEVDVETAKNASLDALLVSWGFRSKAALRAAGAERIADTPEDLFKELLKNR